MLVQYFGLISLSYNQSIWKSGFGNFQVINVFERKCPFVKIFPTATETNRGNSMMDLRDKTLKFSVQVYIFFAFLPFLFSSTSL